MPGAPGKALRRSHNFCLVTALVLYTYVASINVTSVKLCDSLPHAKQVPYVQYHAVTLPSRTKYDLSRSMSYNMVRITSFKHIGRRIRVGVELP